MPENTYVAIAECSDGNESVGSMWFETHICTGETTIDEIMLWKAHLRAANGKLIISKPS